MWHHRVSRDSGHPTSPATAYLLQLTTSTTPATPLTCIFWSPDTNTSKCPLGSAIIVVFGKCRGDLTDIRVRVLVHASGPLPAGKQRQECVKHLPRLPQDEEAWKTRAGRQAKHLASYEEVHNTWQSKPTSRQGALGGGGGGGIPFGFGLSTVRMGCKMSLVSSFFFSVLCGQVDVTRAGT